jgi:hypothetical protein
MSDASRILAAILLIAVPMVEFGGLALLGMLAAEVGHPDRVRGSADSHAAWLLPFGDPARRAVA